AFSCKRIARLDREAGGRTKRRLRVTSPNIQLNGVDENKYLNLLPTFKTVAFKYLQTKLYAANNRYYLEFLDALIGRRNLSLSYSHFKWIRNSTTSDARL
ncbi:hypothetical protein PFISCL1PPCAC_12033, partial [Pristionchus fissidentatus]